MSANHISKRHAPVVEQPACAPTERRSGARVAAAVAAALAGAWVSPLVSAQQAPAATAGEIDEIIVTARRRDEAVQSIPLTIDVLRGDALQEQGVYKFQELQYTVPGFVVQTYETRATIAMRGVGAQIAGQGSAVATHLNGIYQASTASSLNRLFDVERVEVLKGPQGTLYGRNATGGAINIISRMPGRDGDAALTVGYGSFDTTRAEGGFDVALGDNWAMRIAGALARGGGRITNVVTGQKVGDRDFTGGRLSLAGDIGAVKAEFFVQDSSEIDNSIGGLIPINTATRQPLLGWDRTFIDDPTEPTLERRYFMTGLTLTGEIGNGYSWRSVTGYLDYDEPKSLLDVNPIPNAAARQVISFPQFAEQTSQELQLLYAGERANWVIGALYMDAENGESRLVDIRPALPGALNSQSRTKLRTTAAFADLNYGLTDSLRLTLGLRYNDDKVSNRFTGTGAFDGPSYNRSGSQTEPTGRIGLDYTLSPGVMFYGSVAKGFQGGYFTQGFSGTGVSAVVEVKPENLMAYELGTKLRMPGGNGFLNVAGFYYDYQDMQVNRGGIYFLPNGLPDPARPPFFTADNAGEARIYGVDVALTGVRFSDHFGFELNAEYLNTEFKEYNTFTNAGVPISYAGNSLPRAPELSGTVALLLDGLTVGSGEASLRLEYAYRDDAFDRADNVFVLESRGLVNVVGTLELGKWQVTATGRNLTDEQFFDFYDGRNFGVPGEFRSYEIGLRYKFR